MHLKLFKKIITALLIFVFLVPLAGCGLKEEESPAVDEIEVWGVWDDSDVMDEILNNYKREHPTVQRITYRKFTYEEYENELIKALAAGKGPDIFTVHHTWLARHKDLMISLEEATDNYNKAIKSASGCSKPPLIEEPLISHRQYIESFVDAAYTDFTDNNQIYGLPLSVDTLALFYNEDLFKLAGYSLPPKTWDEFRLYTEKITKKDEFGNIIQAGAALGTADNINRSSDILAMLMMQYGCPMVQKGNQRSSFMTRTNKPGTTEIYTPALEAFTFYNSFANGSSPNYTWNPRLHNSIDSFQEGKTAMLLNYTYTISNIKNKAPKLNFKVAAIPQVANATPEQTLSYPNYWGYVVAKKPGEKPSKVLEAWKILKFLGEKDQVALYSQKTGRPASRRDVIQEQINDPEIGVFAQQALTAKSWYQPNELKVEAIFDAAIQEAALGYTDVEKALKKINDNIDLLLK